MNDFHDHQHHTCHRGGPHRHRKARHARGFGPGGFGPGRGRRASRGDVRAAVLLLLAEEPRNGYALMQAIEERTDGLWRPSPGSMYPALAMLEDEGLVRAQESGGSGRTFELTDAGRAHVAEHEGEDPFAAVVGQVSPPAREMGKLFAEIGRLAMHEVARHGTPEQVAQAVRLLEDTRRGLYRILAGDAGRPGGGEAA